MGSLDQFLLKRSKYIVKVLSEVMVCTLQLIHACSFQHVLSIPSYSLSSCTLHISTTTIQSVHNASPLCIWIHRTYFSWSNNWADYLAGWKLGTIWVLEEGPFTVIRRYQALSYLTTLRHLGYTSVYIIWGYHKTRCYILLCYSYLL